MSPIDRINSMGIMFNITDNELDYTLSNEHGIGLRYTKDEEEYVTVYEGENPRRVMLDITTWKGVTQGALHYYGELRIPSLKAETTAGKRVYLDNNAPQQSRGLKIQLTRPIRKRDLLIDRGERFKGAQLGEKIKNFDTKREVEAAAVKIFKKHFSGNWHLVKLNPQTSSSINGVALENSEDVLCELS